MKAFKPFTHKYIHDLEHMEIYDHVTHGDLCIYKIANSDMPKNFDSLPDKELGVLAEGEAHAHAHQLFEDADKPRPAFEVIEGGKNEGVKYTLKESEGGAMFLKIQGAPLLLKHQTHEVFRLYPGNYDVDFQQEVDHWSRELRRLAD